MKSKFDVLYVFKAHTPLQLLTVSNIKLQYYRESYSILFTQGKELDGLLDLSCWEEVHRCSDTARISKNRRKKILAALSSFREVIEGKSFKKLVFFISELDQMTNLAMYGYLKKLLRDRLEINFFVEGVGNYTQINGNHMIPYWRCFAKYLWMKFAGIPTCHLVGTQYFRRGVVNGLYAYHQNLIEHKESIKTSIYPIDSNFLSMLHLNLPQLQVVGGPKTVLFLSQPYHYSIPEEKFKSLIDGLKQYFVNEGMVEFYFKAHHFEPIKWKNFIIEKGFKEVDFHGMPVEAYSLYLKHAVVVSFTSSALVNLKAFGYKGRIASYGMERCEPKEHCVSIEDLFVKVGVEVIA